MTLSKAKGPSPKDSWALIVEAILQLCKPVIGFYYRELGPGVSNQIRTLEQNTNRVTQHFWAT